MSRETTTGKSPREIITNLVEHKAILIKALEAIKARNQRPGVIDINWRIADTAINRIKNF